MKTRDYIDLARDLTETRTDYAVAKLLDLSHDAVSGYSHGRRVMDNKTALRLSVLLKREFAELVEAAEMERTTNKEQRKVLERLFKLARAHAAALATLILAAPILQNGADAMAATRSLEPVAPWASGCGAERSAPNDNLTIMRHSGRTAWRAVRHWFSRFRSYPTRCAFSP